jgi:hypothetical protein
MSENEELERNLKEDILDILRLYSCIRLER